VANEILIKALADFKDATRQVNTFSKSTDKSLNTISNGFKNIQRVAVAAFAFVGARAAINTLRETVQSVADLGDTAIKTADKLGVNVEALQELRFAAERSGIAAGTFDVALQRFTRRVAEAASGTGEARAALKELGIQLRDNQNQLRPSAELLEEVADRFQSLGSESDRVRLAFKLFDTEGVALVNLLNEGSEGVRSLREEFRSLGGVLDRDATQRAVELKDAQTNLDVAIQGVKNTIAVELLPVFTELTRQNTDLIAKNRELIANGIVPLIKEGFRALANATPVVLVALSDINTAIGKTQAFFTETTRIFQRFTTTLAGMALEITNNRKAQRALLEEQRRIEEAIDDEIAAINKSTDARGDALDQAILLAQQAADSTNAAIDGSNRETDNFIANQSKKLDAVNQLSEEQLNKISAVNEAEVNQVVARIDLLRDLNEFGNADRITQEKKTLGEILRSRQFTSDASLRIQKRLRDQETKINQERLGAAKSALGALAQFQNAKTKEIATVAKAAAIASTIISTIEGAQKAATALAFFPPAAVAAAAAFTVAGFARVAQIAGTPLQTGLTEVPPGFPLDTFAARLSSGERIVSAVIRITHHCLRKYLED
jgi:hypothetical protein